MTICPYKLVLMATTVVFAALVAIYSIPEEEECEDEYAEEKRREKEAHAARLVRRRSLRSSCGDDAHAHADGDGSATPLFRLFGTNGATDWMAYRPRWFRDFKRGSPKTFRSVYLGCVTLLVIFHLEIFSGGWICRQLFAKGANSTLTAGINASAAAIAA